MRHAEPRPGDIVAALGELGLLEDARISGAEAYILCPYHPDRRIGSFSISLDTGACYCFSCGNGGSFLRFLMTSRHMSRDEARRWCLSRLITIHPPGHDDHPGSRPGTPRIPEVSEASLAVYQPAPGTRNASAESCQALGILHDPVSGSLIFPVRAHDGRLLGWQEKNRHRIRNHPRGVPVKSCLFGWHLVTPGSSIALVESPLDTAVMRDAGFQAVASYGAGVSDEQLAMIAERCSRLILALDDDPAGWNATSRILRRPSHIPVRVFGYGPSPAGKDPGELGHAAIRRGMRNLLC
jgi:hypothetical protein